MNDPLLLVARSPRQEALLTMARDLAAITAARAAEHDRAGVLPRANYDDIRAARYHTLTVPTEFGGMGATLLETVLCQEQLAQGDGATALTIDMHLHVVGTEAAQRAWPAGRFAAFCKQVVGEGALINAAGSEPELGSPSRGGLPATVARRQGDGWRITGRKTWTSGIEVLSHVIVTCAIEAPDRPHGTIGVFLVPTKASGMRIEHTWDPLGMRTTGSHDMLLEDLPLPPEALLDERAPGSKPTSSAAGSAWFGLTVSAVYLGIATAARDFALSFAQERRPSALEGRSIATLEPIQRQLGQIEGLLLPARALLYSLADSWDRAGEQQAALLPAVGFCKVQAVGNAIAAVDAAMRVVGGSSMSRALPIERYFRDVRAGLFHPPNEEAGLVALGKALAAG